MALYEMPFAAGVYLLLLAVASAYDLHSRRIPNVLVVTVLISGLAWVVYARGLIDAALALVCGVGMVILLWVPWDLGGIGGGDVKLAAAAVAWAGHRQAIAFVLVGAVAGGIVAAGAYAASKSSARAEMRRNLLLAALWRRLPEAPEIGDDEKTGRVSVPYALAILAAGAYIVFAPRWS